MKKLLVSICCITYNHKPFIRDAIEGFLIQKTNFPFEIIIHDDASTDDTAEIVKEYAEKYPNLITLIQQKENQYSKGISPFVFIFPEVFSKYVALCEGDDYWTDPLKLQKQVDFLEKNKNYSICFHSVKILKNGELIDDYITRKVPSETTIYDLAKGNYIHTPTCVFRKEWDKLPSWFSSSPVGDYPLHMINAQDGKIKFLNEPMAIYRIHDSNMWVNQSSEFKNEKYLSVLIAMMGSFEERVNKIIEDSYIRAASKLIGLYTGEKKHGKAIKTYYFVKKRFNLYRFIGKGFSPFVSSYIRAIIKRYKRFFKRKQL
jgi:glycosyltransferase involved in cell wall biosynthesis